MSRVIPFALTCLAGLAAPIVSLGQPMSEPVAPPFALVQVTTREARLGMQDQIEEYYVKLRAAEAKLGIDGLTDIYVVAQGGRTQVYKAFRPATSWADLDDDVPARSRDTLTRAYGDAEARRLGQAMSGASESVTTEVLEIDGGLSNWRPSSTGRPWPYMQVRRNVVKPGMQRQYLQFAARMRDARARAGAVPEVRWHVVEGAGAVHGTTRYFRGWQDRNLWESELAVVFGDDEAASLVAQFDGAIERTETYVLRHRHDLSRASGATSSQQ
jgi:hypothetical protein